MFRPMTPAVGITRHTRCECARHGRADAAVILSAIALSINKSQTKRQEKHHLTVWSFKGKYISQTSIDASAHNAIIRQLP
jgi:hypothetical protein